LSRTWNESVHLATLAMAWSLCVRPFAGCAPACMRFMAYERTLACLCRQVCITLKHWVSMTRAWQSWSGGRCDSSGSCNHLRLKMQVTCHFGVADIDQLQHRLAHHVATAGAVQIGSRSLQAYCCMRMILHCFICKALELLQLLWIIFACIMRLN